VPVPESELASVSVSVSEPGMASESALAWA